MGFTKVRRHLAVMALVGGKARFLTCLVVAHRHIQVCLAMVIPRTHLMVHLTVHPKPRWVGLAARGRHPYMAYLGVLHNQNYQLGLFLLELLLMQACGSLEISPTGSVLAMWRKRSSRSIFLC